MSHQILDPASSAGNLSGVFSCDQPVGIVNCYKILSGRADIRSSVTGKTTNCRYDYALLKKTKGSNISEQKLAKGMFGEDVGIEDAREILEKIKNQNRRFFDRLLSEMSLCVECDIENRPVEKFLYFYRCLEYIAISFPLYYFSRKSDFLQSHGLLKEFFSGDAGGELKAIRKLSAFFANESDVLRDYTVTFSRKSMDSSQSGRIIDQIFDRIPEKMQENAEIGDGYIKLPYEDVAPLIIHSRNLIFHNSNSGQNNFDLAQLGGAQNLCGFLVSGGMNWLALTFLEILRDRASRA